MREIRVCHVIFIGQPRGATFPLLYRFVNWLLRTLVGSRITHCCIEHAGLVMDPCFRTTGFWPVRDFLRVNPTLAAVFRVLTPRPVDFRPFYGQYGRVKPIWPSIRRWMSRGRGPLTEDCLCTVMQCLIEAGLNVPQRLATPIAFLRWLKEQGYESRERSASGGQWRTAVRQFLSD